MINLWEDETPDRTEVEEKVAEQARPIPDGKDLIIQVDKENNKIVINSNVDLSDNAAFIYLIYAEVEENETYLITAPYRPVNCFVLRYLLKGYKVSIDAETVALMKESADKVPHPSVKLADTGKHLEVTIPSIEVYRELVKLLNGYPVAGGNYRVQISKILDLQSFSETMTGVMPKLKFSKEVLELTSEPLPGFDGTMESLKTISVGELNVIKANSQSYKAVKKSSKILIDKMKEFGIESLFDLIHWLPKRYIDKSAPQDLTTLIVDEPATIVGKIESCSELPGSKGVVFTIVDELGYKVRATFWRQIWLKNKFKPGSEVLITGKFGFYGRQPQLNGTSIESSQEAALLPIVPIYKQSESKGITTSLILAAMRETFARIGEIRLPEYLAKEGRASYDQVYQELHLPTDLEYNKKMVNYLAYYELVLMQLLIQEQKELSASRPGLAQKKTKINLQEKAINLLPFTLTNSQQESIKTLNTQLANGTPSTTLLNADVGSGKGLRENDYVITPNGKKMMKDLKVGDHIVGSNGKPTKIVGVYPQGEQEVAKITFSDDTSIITDLNHLWNVQELEQFSAKYKCSVLPSKTISTKQLLSQEKQEVEITYSNEKGVIRKQKQFINTNFKKSTGLRWKIPLISEPVEYENNNELPIHPYILGAWLGDGSSTSSDIYSTYEDNDYFEMKSILENYWNGKVSTEEGNSGPVITLKGNLLQDSLITIIKKIGLYKNKRIPEVYLLSSIDDRLNLLQGLLDTNGYVDKGGSIYFHNTNKNIIDGVCEIVRSLGGTAKISERIKTFSYKEKKINEKTSYAVIISLPIEINPFKFERKRERVISIVPKRSHRLTKKIVNVEMLPEKERTICIKVDAEDELFLADNFIVTHNTIVSQMACLRSVEAGYQTVLLAPTDVLAQQLHSTFIKIIDSLNANGENLTIEYLGASIKAAEKRRIKKEIKEGNTNIIVGTHAVLSSSVEFKNLGFIAIDEQQKFGAEQRSALLSIREDGRIPDLLMQSATPIPRSVAQVFYGDIDMILLNEKPPGRIPIVTKWVEEDPSVLMEQAINPMWADISEESAKGNQTFVITPLVVDSDSVDAASVERTYEALSRKIFPGLRVAFVHGKMKNEESNEIMQKFRNREYDILVASTVVEVGVDIPDATRVIVMSADRLGASSLHQIRGRVGRSSKPSICYLVSLGKTDNSRIRLTSLVENADGFEVAKQDLLTRGEGTVFGGNQSGASEMVFATLSRHGKLIERATSEAKDILNSECRDKALSESKEFFDKTSRLV